MNKLLTGIGSVEGLHFQDVGHSFSVYGPPSRQIALLITFSKLLQEIISLMLFALDFLSTIKASVPDKFNGTVLK